MKRRNKIIVFFLLLGLWLAGSTVDYHEEQRQQNFYCESVRDGTHPDYNGNYHEVCIND